MADSILSKPFSEGAPLDANALNDLRTDLLNTYAKTNILYSNTAGGQQQNYKFIFNCGEIKGFATTKGVSSSIPLNLGTGFEVSPDPIVTVSVGLVPSGANTVNAYVVPVSSGSYNLYVQSTVAGLQPTIYWTAIQKIPVES